MTKQAGHFKPTYSIANGKVEWQGGTIVVDFGMVDLATEGPYSTRNGDVGLLAHEIGHADHYEANHQEFIALTYTEQETVADKLRDIVLTQNRTRKAQEVWYGRFIQRYRLLQRRRCLPLGVSVTQYV